MLKLKKFLLTGLFVCTAVGIANAGFSLHDKNLANTTATTASTLASTVLVPVFDLVAGDAIFLTATDIGGLGAGATKAELDQAADLSAKAETVITTNVIVSTECGKTFYLDLVGGFTSTLPAPSVGCELNFKIVTSPTTAYIIVSNGGADVIRVHVNELETDTMDDGPYDTNADTVNFVANIAVEGDYLKCSSDGLTWFCNGQTMADGGVTSSTT